jgi:hypothetical protein
MPDLPAQDLTLGSDDRWDYRAEFGSANVVAALGSAEATGKRLNLFIPAISEKSAFGGISTALRFFGNLAVHFRYVRIIVTEESLQDFEPHRWPRWSTHSGFGPQTILFIGDHEATLSVAEDDVFVATAFHTFIYCQYVVSRQLRWFPSANRQIVYLIQDYEPAFFAWSVLYAYAELTYHQTENVIAVFNTSQLAKYFAKENLHFPTQYVFEPKLNDRLRRRRAVACIKERLILVYARPAIERNGFSIIVKALKIWSAEFPSARDWTVISDGDPHADIELNCGVILQSRGKSNLDEYSDYLSRCWVGISIVFSPHPGYSVLEIAEFGAWTITNKWKTKDPSDISPNVLAVDLPTPQSLAKHLCWSCAQYAPGKTSVVPDLPAILGREGAEFPFLAELMFTWQTCRAKGDEERAVSHTT